MITRFNDDKEEIRGNKYIKVFYHCENGAGHDDFCCPSCWNKHPDKRLHLGELNSDDAFKNFQKHYK